MSAERCQQILLELERGEPIHGLLRDEAGESHAFHGWLELSAALERAREAQEPEPPIDEQVGRS